MADGSRCWVMGMMGFGIHMATVVFFSTHPMAFRGPRECNWEVVQDAMSGGITGLGQCAPFNPSL